MTRKQRRAVKDGERDLPLAQPDRSGPKGESLLDLAAKRQAELDAAKPAASGGQTPRPTPPTTPVDADRDDEALANACIYAITLSMVHFTLDVLVYHQYAQFMEWNGIFRRIATILPSFGVIVYILHTRSALKLRWLRQVLFFLFSCGAGCYLIRTGNEEAYIAVMRRAPPLGTLLIWSFIEMDLPFGVASLLMIGGYLWWKGYTVI